MKKKILVIDDDQEFVDAMRTLLESKGYSVVTAENGKDGVEKAKAELPDLILLDVMMATKGEGFDVSREFSSNKETKDIPIVMITGVRREMNLSFGFEPDDTWLPVKAFLEKPVKPEVLLQTIEEHIIK